MILSKIFVRNVWENIWYIKSDTTYWYFDIPQYRTSLALPNSYFESNKWQINWAIPGQNNARRGQPCNGFQPSSGKFKPPQMGTAKLCQPSTDSLKPKTAGHVTFCRLSHRGPRSNSSQAWRQSTVISRVITLIHASLSRMWYIPRQYINLQDAYEMCFGNIKHSNMTPGKLFE